MRVYGTDVGGNTQDDGYQEAYNNKFLEVGKDVLNGLVGGILGVNPISASKNLIDKVNNARNIENVSQNQSAKNLVKNIVNNPEYTYSGTASNIDGYKSTKSRKNTKTGVVENYDDATGQWVVEDSTPQYVFSSRNDGTGNAYRTRENINTGEIEYLDDATGQWMKRGSQSTTTPSKSYYPEKIGYSSGYEAPEEETVQIHPSTVNSDGSINHYSSDGKLSYVSQPIKENSYTEEDAKKDQEYLSRPTSYIGGISNIPRLKEAENRLRENGYEVPSIKGPEEALNDFLTAFSSVFRK